jgi:hypothetical protein
VFWTNVGNFICSAKNKSGFQHQNSGGKYRFFRHPISGTRHFIVSLNAKFCFLLYPTDIIPIFRLSNHTFHYQRLFHTSLADIPYILAADNCEPLGS